MQVEKEIVQDDSTRLEAYLKVLETQMAAKEAVMAKYKESSKKYKQAKADLEALQERYQEYSQTLLKAPKPLQSRS